MDSEWDFMSTVKAEDAALLAEDKIEDGVYSGHGADPLAGDTLVEQS